MQLPGTTSHCTSLTNCPACLLQLYTWGVAFNAATFAAMQRGGGGAAAVLSLAWLPCANVWHVLLILVFACVGIVTGIVLKYHGGAPARDRC